MHDRGARAAAFLPNNGGRCQFVDDPTPSPSPPSPPFAVAANPCETDPCLCMQDVKNDDGSEWKDKQENTCAAYYAADAEDRCTWTGRGAAQEKALALGWDAEKKEYIEPPPTTQCCACGGGEKKIADPITMSFKLTGKIKDEICDNVDDDAMKMKVRKSIADFLEVNSDDCCIDEGCDPDKCPVVLDLDCPARRRRLDVGGPATVEAKVEKVAFEDTQEVLRTIAEIGGKLAKNDLSVLDTMFAPVKDKIKKSFAQVVAEAEEEAEGTGGGVAEVMVNIPVAIRKAVSKAVLEVLGQPDTAGGHVLSGKKPSVASASFAMGTPPASFTPAKTCSTFEFYLEPAWAEGITCDDIDAVEAKTAFLEFVKEEILFRAEDVTVTELNCEEWSPTTVEPTTMDVTTDPPSQRMLEAPDPQPDILDPEAIGDERPTRPTRELHYSPEPTHPAIAIVACNIGIVDKAIDEAIGTEAKHAILEAKVKATWKDYMKAGKFNEEKRKGALTSLFGAGNYEKMAAKYPDRWADDTFAELKKTYLHFAWMAVPDAHYEGRPPLGAGPERRRLEDIAPMPRPRRLLFGDDDEETGPVAGRSLHFEDDHHFLIEPSPAPGDPEPEKRWIEATTGAAASVCEFGCEPGFYPSGPMVCGEDGLRHCLEIPGKANSCLAILTKLLNGEKTTNYQRKRWMDGQARCVPYHPSSPPPTPPSPPPFAPPSAPPPSTPPSRRRRPRRRSRPPRAAVRAAVDAAVAAAVRAAVDAADAAAAAAVDAAVDAAGAAPLRAAVDPAVLAAEAAPLRAAVDAAVDAAGAAAVHAAVAAAVPGDWADVRGRPSSLLLRVRRRHRPPG